MYRLRLIKRGNLFQSLVKHALLAFSSRVINQLGYAVLFFVISRQQDAGAAGVFALAMRYFALFAILALWGLEGYLIREISANPLNTRRLLANSILSRLVFATSAIFLLYVFLKTRSDYKADVESVILLMALGIVPEVINRLFQAVFIAHQRFAYPLAIASVLCVIRIVCGVYWITIHSSLETIAFSLSMIGLLGVLLSVYFYRSLAHALTSSISTSSGLDFTRHSWFNGQAYHSEISKATPFALMEIFISIEQQADIFILSFLSSEDQIGYYAAAQMIVSLLSFIQFGYYAGLFPMMTRLFHHDQEKLWTLYRRLYRYAGFLIFSAALLFTLLARPIIHWIFTDAYDPAVLVMGWLVWGLALQLLDEPNSRLIVISGHQNQVTGFLAVSMVLNILFNLFFISRFGIVGAAMAKLASKLVFTTLNGFYVYWQVSRINLLPTLGKLSIGAIAASAILIKIPLENLWFRAFTAGIFYLSITVLLGIVKPNEISRLITRKGY